jgi:hypothetical protein
MSYTEKFRKEKMRVFEGQSGDTLYFGCAPVGAFDALKIQFKLQKLLGPAILAIAGGYSSIADLLKDSSAMVSLIRTLQELDLYDADIANIIGKFAEKTQFSYDGNHWMVMQKPGQVSKTSFDEVFLGNHDLIYKWLMFHLEINFKGFLDSLKSASSASDQDGAHQKTAE